MQGGGAYCAPVDAMAKEAPRAKDQATDRAKQSLGTG